MAVKTVRLVWDPVNDEYYRGKEDPANLISMGGGTGSGDVTGPSSAVVDNIATFNNTNGKVIKDSGVGIASILSRSNVLAYISRGPF